jgi:hypothetical protein
MLDIIVYQLSNGFRFTQSQKSDGTILAITCNDLPFPENPELNAGFRIKERLHEGTRLVIERV